MHLNINSICRQFIDEAVKKGLLIYPKNATRRSSFKKITKRMVFNRKSRKHLIRLGMPDRLNQSTDFFRLKRQLTKISRLSQARNAFANLRPVWQSSVYSIRTKLHLYSSIDKSILLYGYRSVCKLLKWISIRLRHFTMDAYAGSVGFSGLGPSQIWSCTPKQILSQFRQQLKGVVSGGSDMF